jgi:cell division protein FtsI/penicillin-binding protein 2
MRPSRTAPWLVGASVALFAALALPWPRRAAGDGAPARAEAAAQPAEPRLGEPTLDLDLGRYVAPLGESRAILTLEPGLQSALERLLADYRVPWGATVLLEPRTGKVLALAQHSRKEPEARDLSLRAMAPAASIFKIVTAAALLERGVEPESAICYHGGRHRIARGSLADDPRRDRRCLTLAAALGQSANVVFAKLADRDLSAELLRTEAERLFFNVPIPFDRPVQISRAEIPGDPFGLATTAAGFGPVRLSALHAALLAAIVANGGLFVAPRLVEAVEGEGPLPAAEPRRVLAERIAFWIGEMMRTTVTQGTARRVFRERTRRNPLEAVTVAGKTGSIAERSPDYRDYSWFVGFAPVENPRIAVASVVVNDRLWRVKAPYVAKEALKAYFAAEPLRAEAAPLAGVRTAWR